MSVQVLLSLAVTILAFGGMFGPFTYIAYSLAEVSCFETGTAPCLLVLFGLGILPPPELIAPGAITFAEASRLEDAA